MIVELEGTSTRRTIAILAIAFGLQVRETLALREQLAREVGRSEVATGVLHDVGNVLNGINVTVGLAAEALRDSRVPNLAKAVAMLGEHAHDLGAFVRDDPRGRILLPYLEKLAAQLVAERDRLRSEVESLTAGVDHIKNVVRSQQAYAKAGGVVERCLVADLVDDALRLEANRGIEVDRAEVGTEVVAVEKHKTLQILVNLLTNARQAIERAGRGAGRIRLRTEVAGERLRIEVIDDGVGISEENLGKIFQYGFTTSREGHGFGLHNSANAASEMGGSLRCRSDGPGTGATFTLELPLAAAAA